MGIVEKLRSPSVDAIAGRIFIVAESANTLWFIAEGAIRVSSLDRSVYFLHPYGIPLWASALSTLMSLATFIVIGLGIIRGRAWALWVQGLSSFRGAFALVVRPAVIAPSPYIIASFCLNALIFVYAAARISGLLGDGTRPLFRKVALAD